MVKNVNLKRTSKMEQSICRSVGFVVPVHGHLCKIQANIHTPSTSFSRMQDLGVKIAFYSKLNEDLSALSGTGSTDSSQVNNLMV
jgi:hypothetical protein